MNKHLERNLNQIINKKFSMQIDSLESRMIKVDEVFKSNIMKINSDDNYEIIVGVESLSLIHI